MPLRHYYAISAAFAILLPLLHTIVIVIDYAITITLAFIRHYYFAFRHTDAFIAITFLHIIIFHYAAAITPLIIIYAAIISLRHYC